MVRQPRSSGPLDGRRYPVLVVRWFLLYPFRLVGSAFYWAQFRVGGKVRARVTSIEIDNRILWEKVFALESRLATLESHEAERNQAVLIERVLTRFPEKG